MWILNNDRGRHPRRLIALLAGGLLALMMGIELLPVRAAAAAPVVPDPPNSGVVCEHKSVVDLKKGTENVFWPGITSPAGGVAAPGQAVGAWYSDETHVNNPTNPNQVHFDRRIHFTLSRVAASTTVIADYMPATIARTINNNVDNQHRECRFQQFITATLPNIIDPGHYVVDLTAWDSDFLAQHHDTSNDFGIAHWAFDIGVPPGTLTGTIQDCAGNHVAGGGITAAGPTPVTTPANPLSATVTPGTYSETATAPINWHFTVCNNFNGSGTTATINNINVPAGGTAGAIFYVAQNEGPGPGTLTGVILFCNADGTVRSAASGTITIPGTTAAGGKPAPVTVTTAAGTYVVTASNAPSGYQFVSCVGGGGTVSGDKSRATQNGVVTPDHNTTVTFYVQLIPGQSVQGTSTGSGATNSGGVQAATTPAQPNTGRGDQGGSDQGRSLAVAVLMVILGTAVLVGQACYRPAPPRVV